jgi:predicted metalloprotease with PDZ domain
MQRARRRLGVLSSILVVMVAAGCPRRGGSGGSDGGGVEYRFVLEHEPALAVRVEVTTAGGDSGFTDFEVAREWGGVDTGGDDLVEAAAVSAGGRRLAVEHPAPERWRVAHTAREPITFSYRIRANAHRRNASPDVNRRPIVEERLFHGFGHLVLATPRVANPERRRTTSFTWDGFDAAGWKVVSSFGIGSARRDLQLSRHDVRESVWLAGDFALVRRDIAGHLLWTAVAGRDWKFAAEELADLAARIVGAEREFFADLEQPPYLITLIPVGEPDGRNRSIGGTAFPNAFALQMLPDTPLGGDFGRGLHVPSLLAHEMFHFWDGLTIRPADPEQLCYWFTEGFTDFYTRRILYRDGLVTLDEYARSASTKLSDLWTSEVREAPNARIADDFWKHEAVKRLPYVRGDIVAMIVDHGIRRHSRGEHSLDDLMRKLVRDARSSGERVTTETLLAEFERWAGAKVAAEVRRIVVEGALPSLDPALFAPCLTIESAEIVPFDLGFDFATSRAAGVVTGVVPGSAAAAAGLRDGQTLKGWSVGFGDVSQAVAMRIAEADTTREITYMPRRATVTVPQFRVAEPAPAGICPGL